MAASAAQTQRITASTAVGTSGNVTVVWAISLSNGTDTTSLILRNGTGASAAAKWEIDIPSAAGATTSNQLIAFALPIIFPLGCYASLTGTGAVAYVAYEDRNV